MRACVCVHACMCVRVCVLELKQILDSLGYLLSYISIRIPREYSNTQLYRLSALILTCFVKYFSN